MAAGNAVCAADSGVESAGAGASSPKSLGDAGEPRVDRQRRYDRGIRVWGAHGQARLEAARVCLLGAGATGAEALKNLVLGGLRSFTVVDGARVAAADLGSNFLVAREDLGRPRAAAVADRLRELNAEVAGGFVEEDPAVLVAARPAFLARFDLVIGAQLSDEVAEAVAVACASAGAGAGPALLLARTYGLAGYVRACFAEHCVVESRPDSEALDLRVDAPWPELAAAAGAVALEALGEAEHAHVPYALLLAKAAAAWRAAHGGALPEGAEGRTAFRALLRSWQRAIDGCPVPEENFAEAAAHAHLVWAPPGAPPELRAVLEDAAAAAADAGGPGAAGAAPFWVLAAALRRFVAAEGGGLPPLGGALPDMHSTTAAYLALQRLYREKAEADAAAVERHARAVAEAGGAAAPTAAEVRRFCRHARHLRVVRAPPLAEELRAAAGSRAARALREALASEERAAPAALRVLLRAADRFRAQRGRFPGAPGCEADADADAAALKAAAGAVLAEAGAPGAPLSDDLVGEAVRAGAGEPHAVAAAVGAIAAQEAIKLLTGQFVPLAGPLIYDAARCVATVLHL
jgi:amyloid beta precursor protein binding protein 1